MGEEDNIGPVVNGDEFGARMGKLTGWYEGTYGGNQPPKAVRVVRNPNSESVAQPGSTIDDIVSSKGNDEGTSDGSPIRNAVFEFSEFWC